MKNIPLSMLLLGALVSQTSCAEEGGSLRILRNQAPGEDCVVPLDEGSEFLSRGFIDVTASSGYLFTPLVESRAISSGNADRRIFLNGAEVKLRFAEGFFDDATLDQLETDGLSHFTQPFSGSIAAEARAAFKFEILPKAVLEAMQSGLAADEVTRVYADVQLHGEDGGGEVTSPTFTYPIEVCNGCLDNDLGSCVGVSDPRPGGFCQEKQDGIRDCCTSGEELVCPAVAPEE